MNSPISHHNFIRSVPTRNSLSQKNRSRQIFYVLILFYGRIFDRLCAIENVLNAFFKKKYPGQVTAGKMSLDWHAFQGDLKYGSLIKKKICGMVQVHHVYPQVRHLRPLSTRRPPLSTSKYYFSGYVSHLHISTCSKKFCVSKNYQILDGII